MTRSQTGSLLFVAASAAVLSVAPPARASDLEPPPPVANPSTTSTTTPDTPSTDESHDSGLGLEWVWLNADVGGAYANMASFNSSQLAIQQASSSGPVYGVGAGVRLIFLTAGVRVSDLQLTAFNLWELNAEAAFHVRVWRIDPYFGVRGGYAFVGTLNSNAVTVATGGSASNVAVHGIDVGPMVGLDIYLAKYVSIGVDGNAQFLFIQRPPVPIPNVSQLPPQAQQAAQQQVMSNPLYQESGSSVGLGLTLSAHLGIHF